MLKNNKFLLLTFALAFITSLSAQAGLITQHTSVGTYQRNCPGLADPAWVTKWKPIADWYYGAPQGITADNSADLLCHFNGGPQATFWNNDGTPKGSEPWWPQGYPFTNSEVGTLTITTQVGANGAVLGAPSDEYYASVILDPANLGLPEFKIKSESDAFERNSVNAFAATEYLWTGADKTLEYTVNYDFFVSGNEWLLPGAPTTHDYAFILEFGFAEDMQFDPNQIFPSDWGNVLINDGFSTTDQPLIVSSPSSPYAGTLTVSLDVTAGDRFFLYGFTQAFGLNGGFADASHTVTSSLGVQGLNEEESQALFATALQAAPPTDPNAIPEPSSMLLACLGLFGLVFRRKLQR